MCNLINAYCIIKTCLKKKKYLIRTVFYELYRYNAFNKYRYPSVDYIIIFLYRVKRLKLTISNNTINHCKHHNNILMAVNIINF